MEEMILDVIADITNTAKSTITAQLNEGLEGDANPNKARIKEVIGKLYKSKLDGQYSRGKSETAKAFEKAIKTVDGFSSDKTGTELVDELKSHTAAIVESSKKSGAMTPEEMLKNPAVIKAITDKGNSVKDAWEKKLATETADYKGKIKALQKVNIYDFVEKTLLEAGAKVTDKDGNFDIKKRRAVRKLADTYNFRPSENGLEVLDADGNAQLNDFSEKVDAKKIILDNLNLWGVKDAREDRSGAGAGGKGGGGKGEGNKERVHNFKTAEEYAKYMSRRDVKVEDKLAAKQEWLEQEKEKKKD